MKAPRETSTAPVGDGEPCGKQDRERKPTPVWPRAQPRGGQLLSSAGNTRHRADSGLRPHTRACQRLARTRVTTRGWRGSPREERRPEGCPWTAGTVSTAPTVLSSPPCGLRLRKVSPVVRFSSHPRPQGPLFLSRPSRPSCGQAPSISGNSTLWPSTELQQHQHLFFTLPTSEMNARLWKAGNTPALQI